MPPPVRLDRRSDAGDAGRAPRRTLLVAPLETIVVEKRSIER